MVAILGRHGTTVPQVITNILTLNTKSVDDIITNRDDAHGSGIRSLTTVSYVEDVVSRMSASAAVFGQNYVSPTYLTQMSDPHRWIIYGATRTTNNSDLLITTSDTAILKVPVGRLSVAGEYILGLKGYITANATVTISMGGAEISTFGNREHTEEIDLSVIIDVVDVNKEIVISITNGLNSYLYSPVYLCSTSALLSYYINAYTRGAFDRLTDAVLLSDLVEYVRVHAIDLADKRYLAKGNIAIPSKTVMVTDCQGEQVLLPIFVQSKRVSDSHGPNSPIGQMGHYIFSNNVYRSPLSTPQLVSKDTINSGVGYKFYSSQYVETLIVSVSISGSYAVHTAVDGVMNTDIVDLAADTITRIPIHNHAQYVTISAAATNNDDVTVSLDLETDLVDRLSVVSGVKIQAVDIISVTSSPINTDSVTDDVWYPVVSDTGGSVTVLTEPFNIASVVSNSGVSAPAVMYVDKTRPGSVERVYARTHTNTSIVLHKPSSVRGYSLIFPSIGTYEVTVSVDGISTTRTVASAIAYDDVYIHYPMFGTNFTFSIVDLSTGVEVSGVLPNIYLESIWYDDKMNTWSDGIDRVVLGYLKKNDTALQFYPRGGSTVQGGRVFHGLESAIVPDPDTGIYSVYWNPSLTASVIPK